MSRPSECTDPNQSRYSHSSPSRTNDEPNRNARLEIGRRAGHSRSRQLWSNQSGCWPVVRYCDSGPARRPPPASGRVEVRHRSQRSPAVHRDAGRHRRPLQRGLRPSIPIADTRSSQRCWGFRVRGHTSVDGHVVSAARDPEDCALEFAPEFGRMLISGSASFYVRQDIPRRQTLLFRRHRAPLAALLYFRCPSYRAVPSKWWQAAFRLMPRAGLR